MFTNTKNIDFPIAVWLAADPDYDLVPSPNTISTTTLQKPIKSIILSNRIQEPVTDISALVPSKVGTALHTDLEKVFTSDKLRIALHNLDYPKQFIDRIVVNPDKPLDTYPDNAFFIYCEKRTNKQIGNYTISGKFDLVIDGSLHDLKTTKVYNYTSGSNDRDYLLQGSIYRWLNPTIITKDYLTLNYILLDWTPLSVFKKDYPSFQTVEKNIPLLSIQETENYIKERLTLLEKYKDADQKHMPDCTFEELWQDPPKWAYYKNPNNKRATKLFDTSSEAYQRLAEDGNKGVVNKRPSKVKRCHFCAANTICDQAASLRNQNLLD
jgi:hypothetical protein